MSAAAVDRTRRRVGRCLPRVSTGTSPSGARCVSSISRRASAAPTAALPLDGHSGLYARVLVIPFGKERSLTNGEPDPRHGCIPLLVGPRVVRSLGGALEAYESARAGVATAVGSPYAAVLSAGHVSQVTDRLACRRARRAASARAASSAGIASPVPKYISSGVWPRNAECGSTRLCSST